MSVPQKLVNVLIVDDEELMREVLCEMLMDQVECIEAANGQVALDLLQEGEIDFIITDIRMPILGGIELVRRARREHPEVPIVVMSAYSDEDIIIEALRAGANNFLRKPTEIHEMEKVILPIIHAIEQKKRHAFDTEAIRQLFGELSLNNEIALIPGTVEHLLQPLQVGPFAPQLHCLRIALYEMITNAIEHGNLELTREEKETALKEDRYEILFQERLGNPKFRNRRIRIRYKYTPHQIYFTIIDEGNGFDWKRFNSSATDLFSKSGRGIILSKMYCDELIYNEKGNQVTLIQKTEDHDKDHINVSNPDIPHILIVDDDPILLTRISHLLAESGYEFEVISMSKPLFTRLEKQHFDLILMDVSIYDTDGLALLKELKKHPIFKEIPVIILTYESDEVLLAACFERGAEDFINKPVRELSFKSRIKSILSRKKTLNQLKAANEKLTQLNEDIHQQYEILSKTEAELKEKHTQIQEDLTLAAKTQQATLPSIPKLSYITAELVFEPYSVVSGDIYYLSEDQNGILNIFLGDATGHGVAASFLTMMARMELQNINPDFTSNETLNQLNSKLANVVPRGNHIAGIYLKISKDGTLNSCSAGNPDGVIIPYEENKEPIIFLGGGIPLGLFPTERVSYNEMNHKLQPGDRLILFTDGIIEWRNRRQEAFGMKRLVEAIKSNRRRELKTLLKQLCALSKEFSENLSCPDDLTILGIEYQGEQIIKPMND